MRHTAPGRFTEQELVEIARLAEARHDARLSLYERGEKQWDVEVSLLMVARGSKRA